MDDIDPREALAPIAPVLHEVLHEARDMAMGQTAYAQGFVTREHISNFTRGHAGLMLRSEPPEGWSATRDINMGFRLTDETQRFSLRLRRWRKGQTLPGPLNSRASRREFQPETLSLLPQVHHVKVAWDFNSHGELLMVAYRPLKPWGRTGPEVCLYQFPLHADPEEVLGLEFDGMEEFVDDAMFLQTPDDLELGDLLQFAAEGDEDEDEDDDD